MASTLTPASSKSGQIVAKELTKFFGPIKAVDHLSFTVEPGSVTGFLGPNGAGKTTTLRLLLGLAQPTSGKGTISGQAYASLPHPGRTVGAVLEATSFHPGRTARNHLRVFCAALGLPDRRADEALAQVGLSQAAKTAVGKYSLGMRQRLGLATALLGNPPVLILDEPANGLDPEGIVWLRQLLRRFADQEGRTVLVSSHILSEVQQTVDRAVIIAQGHLVYDGSLEDLHASKAVLVRTPNPELLQPALVPLQVTMTSSADGSLLVQGASLDSIGHAAWQSQIELHELRESASSLEEAFLKLTEDQPGATT